MCPNKKDTLKEVERSLVNIFQSRCSRVDEFLEVVRQKFHLFPDDGRTSDAQVDAKQLEVVRWHSFFILETLSHQVPLSRTSKLGVVKTTKFF